MLNSYVEHGPVVVARPPSKFCVACQGTRRIADKHHHVKIKAGHFPRGFHIDNPDSTGGPVGRRPRGIHQPYPEMGVLTRILALDGEGKKELNLLLARDPSVNVQKLAEHSGVTRQTINNYRKRGRMLLQNSPTSRGNTTKGDDMETAAATSIATRADIADLRDQMREEHEEIVRILFAFRYGETPVEAWERRASGGGNRIKGRFAPFSIGS
jgi:hypothetical protein